MRRALGSPLVKGAHSAAVSSLLEQKPSGQELFARPDETRSRVLVLRFQLVSPRSHAHERGGTWGRGRPHTPRFPDSLTLSRSLCLSARRGTAKNRGFGALPASAKRATPTTTPGIRNTRESIGPRVLLAVAPSISAQETVVLTRKKEMSSYYDPKSKADDPTWYMVDVEVRFFSRTCPREKKETNPSPRFVADGRRSFPLSPAVHLETRAPDPSRPPPTRLPHRPL